MGADGQHGALPPVTWSAWTNRAFGTNHLIFTVKCYRKGNDDSKSWLQWSYLCNHLSKRWNLHYKRSPVQVLSNCEMLCSLHRLLGFLLGFLQGRKAERKLCVHPGFCHSAINLWHDARLAGSTCWLEGKPHCPRQDVLKALTNRFVRQGIRDNRRNQKAAATWSFSSCQVCRQSKTDGLEQWELITFLCFPPGSQ